MTRPLHYGIYEALLDRDLKEALGRHPELRSVLGKIDFEEQPARYAAFLAAVIEQALRHETDPASRLAFCNRLIEQISGLPDRAHIGGKFLIDAAEPLLLEITPPNYAVQGVPRPVLAPNRQPDRVSPAIGAGTTACSRQGLFDRFGFCRPSAPALPHR